MKSILAIAVFPLLIALVKCQPPNCVNIKHKGTNKCIDVAGVGKGDLLQIWDCNGGTNQQFRFEPLSRSSGGFDVLESNANDGVSKDKLCVDDLGSGGKGNQLGLWTCLFSKTAVQQSWMQSGSTITYSSGSSPTADLCFDLPGGNTTNGNIIWLWDCNGTPNQEWDFVWDGLCGTSLTLV